MQSKSLAYRTNLLMKLLNKQTMVGRSSSNSLRDLVIGACLAATLALFAAPVSAQKDGEERETKVTQAMSQQVYEALTEIQELVEDFDWILNEECFTYQECDQLLPFLDANKPVFVIEYGITPADFCSQANQQGFSALHKNWDLDAYFTDCLKFSSQ